MFEKVLCRIKFLPPFRLTHTGKGLYGNNGAKSAADLILLEQKWSESLENQGLEGSQPVGKDEVPSSNLGSSSKTKGHPFGCPFVLGSDRQRRSPPFGISMLGVGKAAPAPRFSPAVKTLVRRTRAAGQKAGWVQFCPLAENLKIFRL